jgi:integrase/recombinase XerD
VAAYRTDLTQFAAFLQDPANPADMTNPTATMQAFCDWLYARGYKAATVARRITALRAFGAYLVQTGAQPHNPGDALQPPRRTRGTPRPLTVPQLQALCAQPLRRASPERWRDCVLLQLLALTHVRTSALLNLTLADVALETGTVRVPRPNGGVDRIALPPQLLMAVTTYLTLGRPRLVGSNTAEQALFVNQRGQQLTRQGCWAIIKSYAQQLGLDDVTPERVRQGMPAQPGGMRHDSAGIGAFPLA